MTVHSRRVRIIGAVQTKGKPQAQWRSGNDKLHVLPLDKDHNFSLDLPELKPGAQQFAFEATTEGVNKDAASVSIRFAPLPPTVTLIEPDAVNEGEHAGDIIVRGTIKIPKDSAGFKFTSAVLVKDKALPGAKVEFDEKAGSVMVKAPFKPGGVYSVAVSLSNEWGQSTLSNAVLARYWSPPTAIKFGDIAGVVRKPLATLHATVTSRLPLTRTEAHVQSDAGEDTPIPAIKVKRGRADNTWELTLQDVPLAKGRNLVRLSAANEQGAAARPGELTIQYKEPVDAPVVKILGPTKVKVGARDYVLNFSVRSKAALQCVELVQGKVRKPIDKDVSKLAATDGVYELKESLKVTLQPGMNVLGVMAVNEGGKSQAAIEISCVPVPVRIDVDALLTPEGAAIDLKREANGAVLAPQAPTPRLRIQGRVVWDDPNDPLISREGLRVRVFVNGFQQRPGILQAAGKDKPERAFETEILLNRLEDNYIEFELPNLRRSKESRPNVVVARCAAFKQDQWLHLLIIGAGEEKRDTLLNNVLKAMNARKENGTWRTDVFSNIKTYGPLTKADHNLEPEYIHSQLFTIHQRMRERQAAGAGDMVLIYFKGEELIDKTKGHLLTGSQMGMSLASTELANFFTDTRGASLLFLDVERPVQTAEELDQFKSKWPFDNGVSRVGVFRSGHPAKSQPPSDGSTTRLDRALQEEMPKVQALGDLESQLKAKYKLMAAKLPGLAEVSYFYVYPLLEDVVINRKQKQ